MELQLNQNNGRITIDGDLELFTTQGRKYRIGQRTFFLETEAAQEF